MKHMIEIILLPIAIIGFVAMVAFFLVRNLIVVIIISSPVNSLGLIIGNWLPMEIARKMAILYLKVIGFLMVKKHVAKSGSERLDKYQST